MSISFDFQLVHNTQVPGISLVMPMNEEAFDYMVDEADLQPLNNGCAVIATHKLPDLLDDIEQAHMCATLV